jgi:hypothetical protein
MVTTERRNDGTTAHITTERPSDVMTERRCHVGLFAYGDGDERWERR